MAGIKRRIITVTSIRINLLSDYSGSLVSILLGAIATLTLQIEEALTGEIIEFLAKRFRVSKAYIYDARKILRENLEATEADWFGYVH